MNNYQLTCPGRLIISLTFEIPPIRIDFDVIISVLKQYNTNVYTENKPDSSVDCLSTCFIGNRTWYTIMSITNTNRYDN